MGYIRKAIQQGYLEHPRSACCTDDMIEIFVRFEWCLPPPQKVTTCLHVEAKVVEIADMCPNPLHSPPSLTPPSFALGTRLPPEVPPQSSKRYSLSSRVLP